jgi:hypothetical protein
VVGLERPAHDQDVLDVSGGLKVGQRRLHASPDEPAKTKRRQKFEANAEANKCFYYSW